MQFNSTKKNRCQFAVGTGSVDEQLIIMKANNDVEDLVPFVFIKYTGCNAINAI